jgi:hypothetical protein
MNNPTTLTYTSLSTTYDLFNRELFAGSLPPCLITMQRHKGAFGFSEERFRNTVNPEDIADEIALTRCNLQPETQLKSSQPWSMKWRISGSTIMDGVPAKATMISSGLAKCGGSALFPLPPEKSGARKRGRKSAT